MRGYLLAGAMAACVVAAFAGYQRGYAAAEADFNAQLLARIEAGQKLEQARITAIRERDHLSQTLEEQAHADPIVVEQCLGPDRVRRLNELR